MISVYKHVLFASYWDIMLYSNYSRWKSATFPSAEIQTGWARKVTCENKQGGHTKPITCRLGRESLDNGYRGKKGIFIKKAHLEYSERQCRSWYTWCLILYGTFRGYLVFVTYVIQDICGQVHLDDCLRGLVKTYLTKLDPENQLELTNQSMVNTLYVICHT